MEGLCVCTRNLLEDAADCNIISNERMLEEIKLGSDYGEIHFGSDSAESDRRIDWLKFKPRNDHFESKLKLNHTEINRVEIERSIHLSNLESFHPAGIEQSLNHREIINSLLPRLSEGVELTKALQMDYGTERVKSEIMIQHLQQEHFESFPKEQSSNNENFEGDISNLLEASYHESCRKLCVVTGWIEQIFTDEENSEDTSFLDDILNVKSKLSDIICNFQPSIHAENNCLNSNIPHDVVPMEHLSLQRSYRYQRDYVIIKDTSLLLRSLCDKYVNFLSRIRDSE